MAKNYLKSSLENATFNIIIQIVFRCVTFVLNAFVLRHVSQAVIGVMNVRLLLLESTILFLSREAFRRASLTRTTDHDWAQVVNLLWITVPLCQTLCVVFGYIWLYVLTPPDVGITAHYTIGVWSICLSCIIEMICEPIFMAAQAFLFVRLKVALETLHISVRTITFTTLILLDPSCAVLAFSVAQLTAVCVYALGYFAYFYHYMRSKRDDNDDFPFHSLADFLPSRIAQKPLLNSALSRLTWTFFKQGILKQLLTEGERYVMTLFAVLTFYEQGVYDVVNNLGSLAARFLFRPVEDSAYFYFTQMVARDKPIRDQDQLHVRESSEVLRQLLKCVSSVGLLIVTFGQTYARLLLYLYGGEKLIVGPGPLLMRVHCLAVLLLAVNGTTECYAFATMNTAQLDRYNYLMALLSVLFLALSWGFTAVLGGVGFILANCCNMAARIGHSIWYIQNQFEGTSYQPLKGLIPRPCFLVTLGLSAIVTHISEWYLFESSKFLHLCIGGVCFLVVLAAWALEEQELTKLAVERWRHKSAHKQD